MPGKKERIQELIKEKADAESQIDQIWKEADEAEKKQEEKEKAAEAAGTYSYFAATSGLANMGSSMMRTERVDALRRRIARINDELIVNLLDSIDSHSKKLEALTYALIFTSAALIAIAAIQLWRLLG